MKEPTNPKCCCCSSSDGERPSADAVASGIPLRRWITGVIASPAGDVPVVASTLDFADMLGAWKARWAMGRMNYRIEPGLYAVGTPSPGSHVFVSANYKMSFDRLRSALKGLDAWILVLDTDGVNVWCAAGKGTFGTDELIRQVYATNLSNVVSHQRLIVPQLGAPGVSAHEVRKRCGFRVVYGPVGADDIPAFVEADLKATPEMRRVCFPLMDRLAVVPVELIMSAKYVFAIMIALLFLAGLGPGGYLWDRVVGTGLGSAILFATVFVAGTVLAPVLLPWLPGRALSLKGTWIGLLFLLLAAIVLWAAGTQPTSWITVAAWCLIVLVATSFAAMNFTGATTYTSLSGVRREMQVAVPIQATCAVVGTALWIIGRFV